MTCQIIRNDLSPSKQTHVVLNSSESCVWVISALLWDVHKLLTCLQEQLWKSWKWTIRYGARGWECCCPCFFNSFPFLPSRSPLLFALSLTGALWQSAILHGKNWNDKLSFDKLHKQKCFMSSARTRGAKINLTLGFLNSRGSFLQSHNGVWTAVEVHTFTETWTCLIPSHFLKIWKGPTYCKALGDAFRSQPPKNLAIVSL